MTIHQYHTLIKNEDGFYCKTCADRDAIEAYLRNEIELMRAELARKVTSLRSIKAHNSMYTHSIYIDNECADGLMCETALFSPIN